MPETETPTLTHWHISTEWRDGMGDVPDDQYDDWDDTLHAVADMLDYSADVMVDAAHIHAEREDYETAWNERLMADTLGVVAINLRTVANLYTDPGSTMYADMTEERRIDMLDDRAFRILRDMPYFGADTPIVRECPDPEACAAALEEWPY